MQPEDLLFEIGCEEIPAKMLAKQLVELPKAVEAQLAAARLSHQGIRVLGTPRRLGVLVTQLAARQPDVNEEVVGPPISAAFAPDGSLTKAGQGFAAKNGVAPEAIQKKEVAGKKGQYAVAVRNIVGQDTRALLPSLLVELAKSIAWPKSQRWNWSETTFVRPVQWLVALYGGEVVPVQWAGLTASRSSRGHRFMAPGAVEIATANMYVDALRAVYVIADPDARKQIVRDELARLEHETGCKVRPDEALLGEVIHLGEYPVGVSGEFDKSFLEVPEEIIVLSMRNHQRYFAMADAGGKLANRFATMMATNVNDPRVVQKGNEKVLASRLSDAKFFFAEDRKKSFDAWNQKLETVVFQAKLGDAAKTIGQKVRRVRLLAEWIAERVGANVERVGQAAAVCKADLASGAVGEFPELQGVMGRHYAKHFGCPPEVAQAIDEHWWPRGQGGELPQSPIGAILAIADRVDTIVGCFAVGLEPSGNADPFGLRRAAIGVVAILLDRAGAWDLPLSWLIDQSAKSYGDTLAVSGKAVASVKEFFATRLRSLLVEQGVPVVDADAAIAASADDVPDVVVRAKALRRVSPASRAVFKRIANIVEDAHAKKIEYPGSVDEQRFVADVERELWSAWRGADATLASAIDRRDYDALFGQLESLEPVVAKFFDKGGVMVMDPDEKLRSNRLGMLDSIYRRFNAAADLRKLGGAQ